MRRASRSARPVKRVTVSEFRTSVERARRVPTMTTSFRPRVMAVAMAAAVVVTLMTGADYVARAVRLYRSPAPPGS